MVILLMKGGRRCASRGKSGQHRASYHLTSGRLI